MSPRRIAARISGAVAVAALAATAVVGNAAAAPVAASRATVAAEIAPVDATGHPARGYTIVGTGRSINCFAASDQADTAGVATCGSTADGTHGCWHAANPAHVLCLLDPFARTVYRFVLDGSYPRTAAARQPRPVALRLFDGHEYVARIGGAWGPVREHPSWVGYYYARHGANTIYGPKNGVGLDTARPVWTARVYTDTARPGTTRSVARVFHLATAPRPQQ